MRPSSTLLLLLSILSVASCITEDSTQLNDDILGLIVFKSALNDPFSALESWNEDDATACSWKFIQCDPKNARVTKVSLDGLGLSGKIGRGLEKLKSLKTLSLSRNNFTGSINPGLFLISTLEKLNLSHNILTGEIPASFSNLNSIQFLDLSGNSLSGPLPDNLFVNLTSIRFLSLSANSLSGPIPSSLVKCTSLNHLNLSKNQLSGSPNFSGLFSSLKRLRTLDLSYNGLSGPVPEGLGLLHNLKELFLQGNHFFGALPSEIGLCPHLISMDFSNNFFTGAIPDSMQRLNALSFLSLSNNMLTGNFPPWIGNLTALEHVDFSGNGLEGSLPESMAQMRLLKHLILSNNNLTGSIPMSLGLCPSLSVIRLRGNKLTGSIPRELFDLHLVEIDLSENQLFGTIPSGSGKLFESLQVLDLSWNILTGDIPAEIGLNTKLRYLNLSWNHFGATIPPEFGYFPNLTMVDLRNSALVGSIPADICDTGSLSILQLDGNQLTGPIPREIGNCTSLYLLSLSYNNLSGAIPSEISKLNKLKILKLEVNQLNGEIPPELGRLQNLLAVNISHNRLEGRLPPGGVFQNLDESAMEGNLGICSPLLKGPCKLDVPKPLVLDPYALGDRVGSKNRGKQDTETSPGYKHSRFFSFSAIVAISAAVLIALGVVMITLLNASARKRIAFVDNALESTCSSSTTSRGLATGKLILFGSKSSPDWLGLSLESILNKTDKIGEGVFGTVYKASLGAEGRNIAIKRLVSSNILQYPEEFDREVRVLGKARHANLAVLRGYYWTPQLQLIVSEYVAKGSLQAKLHKHSPDSPPLPWAPRFNILLGTAKGLAYLHHSFTPPIIHYNVKPSNILLDENLNPKISDFGLARLVTRLDKHVISNRFQSAPGYVAPELACHSLRVNEKCDVYGYGVLILELVTGRKPVEYGEDNIVILNDHVRVLLEQGNVLECVDTSMGTFPEEEVLPVLKLALVCTSQIPSSRPSMAEVVQILQVIKTPIPQRMEPY